MTPKEKLALFERVANAFELEPGLMTTWCYVGPGDVFPGTFKCFCAIGAAAGLAGALTPGDEATEQHDEAAQWARTNLSDREFGVIVDANDEASNGDRPKAIRKAARRLWAGCKVNP